MPFGARPILRLGKNKTGLICQCVELAVFFGLQCFILLFWQGIYHCLHNIFVWSRFLSFLVLCLLFWIGFELYFYFWMMTNFKQLILIKQLWHTVQCWCRGDYRWNCRLHILSHGGGRRANVQWFQFARQRTSQLQGCRRHGHTHCQRRRCHRLLERFRSLCGPGHDGRGLSSSHLGSIQGHVCHLFQANQEFHSQCFFRRHDQWTHLFLGYHALGGLQESHGQPKTRQSYWKIAVQDSSANPSKSDGRRRIHDLVQWFLSLLYSLWWTHGQHVYCRPGHAGFLYQKYGLKEEMMMVVMMMMMMVVVVVLR